MNRSNNNDDSLKQPESSVESSLETSEEHFRLLVEGVKDYAIFMLDPQGHIVSWNRGAERMKGYRAEEIIGKHFSIFYTKEDLERGHPEEELRIATAEGAYEEEGIRVRKDGSRFWASVLITALRDEEGKLRGFAKVVRDITERKLAEEELRKSESSLSAAQRIAHLGNWEYHIARDEAYWSDELYRIFGFAPQAFVPTYKKFLDLVHPDDRELLRREVRAALYGAHERGHSSVDYRVVRPDGEVRFVSTHYEVVHDASKRPVRLIGTIHDITERKRAEEALKEIREAERRRIARDLHDGVLQDLSYTTAAMGLIMLNAQGTPLEQELQKAIDAVRRAAEGLRAAVNDLRVEEEQDRPFSELVKSLVERNREMARGQQQMGLEVEEGIPATSFGDAGMEILRVIQEALTNARRHSGARNVQVTLNWDGDEIVAEVSDDGRGFGLGTTAGSGVGLKSMHERAVAIGGKLEITSEVGQGTKVQLQVPIRQKG